MSTSKDKEKGSEAEVVQFKTLNAHNRMIERFDGQDYNIWAVYMRNLLTERKLSKYLSKQEDIADYKADEDQEALFDIQFTLGKTQMKHVLHCTTAYDAWEKLRSKHLHSSKSNRIFLKNQFLGLKMKENERMEEFIRRVDDLADQLASLSTDEVSEEDKAIVLTRGVSESYNTVVTALQEADKLDNYERVVSSLINEETKLIEKGQINPDKHDEKAFYSNSRGRGQRGRFRGKGRGQYNRNDANSNNDNKNQSTMKFEGNCRYCNIYGHKESDC